MRNSFSGALCALAFLFVSQVSTAQELDCAKFHTGKYFIASAEYGDTYVTRTSTTQTETGVQLSNGKKFKAVFNVEWTDDCTYVLTLVKEKNSGIPKDTPPLKIKIIETYEDSYLIRAIGYPDLEPILVEAQK